LSAILSKSPVIEREIDQASFLFANDTARAERITSLAARSTVLQDANRCVDGPIDMNDVCEKRVLHITSNLGRGERSTRVRYSHPTAHRPVDIAEPTFFSDYESPQYEDAEQYCYRPNGVSSQGWHSCYRQQPLSGHCRRQIPAKDLVSSRATLSYVGGSNVEGTIVIPVVCARPSA
jgi:hypothetical protein